MSWWRLSDKAPQRVDPQYEPMKWPQDVADALTILTTPAYISYEDNLDKLGILEAVFRPEVKKAVPSSVLAKNWPPPETGTREKMEGTPWEPFQLTR